MTRVLAVVALLSTIDLASTATTGGGVLIQTAEAADFRGRIRRIRLRERSSSESYRVVVRSRTSVGDAPTARVEFKNADGEATGSFEGVATLQAIHLRLPVDVTEGLVLLAETPQGEVRLPLDDLTNTVSADVDDDALGYQAAARIDADGVLQVRFQRRRVELDHVGAYNFTVEISGQRTPLLAHELTHTVQQRNVSKEVVEGASTVETVLYGPDGAELDRQSEPVQVEETPTGIASIALKETRRGKLKLSAWTVDDGRDLSVLASVTDAETQDVVLAAETLQPTKTQRGFVVPLAQNVDSGWNWDLDGDGEYEARVKLQENGELDFDASGEVAALLNGANDNVGEWIDLSEGGRVRLNENGDLDFDAGDEWISLERGGRIRLMENGDIDFDADGDFDAQPPDEELAVGEWIDLSDGGRVRLLENGELDFDADGDWIDLDGGGRVRLEAGGTLDFDADGEWIDLDGGGRVKLNAEGELDFDADGDWIDLDGGGRVRLKENGEIDFDADGDFDALPPNEALAAGEWIDLDGGGRVKLNENGTLDFDADGDWLGRAGGGRVQVADNDFDFDGSDPDDEAGGGTFIFDFRVNVEGATTAAEGVADGSVFAGMPYTLLDVNGGVVGEGSFSGMSTGGYSAFHDGTAGVALVVDDGELLLHAVVEENATSVHHIQVDFGAGFAMELPLFVESHKWILSGDRLPENHTVELVVSDAEGQPLDAVSATGTDPGRAFTGIGNGGIPFKVSRFE